MPKSTINPTQKKKRGRPPNPSGTRVSIPISFARELVERIDAYATKAELSRSAAVRTLVEQTLKRKAK